MGPFPPLFGYEYILAAVVYVSKWINIKATRHDKAKIVVDFSQTNIFCRYSMSKALIMTRIFIFIMG